MLMPEVLLEPVYASHPVSTEGQLCWGVNCSVAAPEGLSHVAEFGSVI